MKSVYAIVSDPGRLSYMEDRYFFVLNLDGKPGTYGGIYDGHGGEKAAEYAAQCLHKMFFHFLEKYYSPEDSFTQAYQIVSDEIREEHTGTCAADFFIREGKIHFANAGDCRIVVVDKRDEHQLTTDHHVNVELEKRRIEASGGQIYGSYVCREDHGLMVTRVLGDHYFGGAGIIPNPSVGSYKILPTDIYLIAGTDGLFSKMGNPEVANQARLKVNPKELALALKEEVLLKRGGKDNLTIIVLKLRAN